MTETLNMEAKIFELKQLVSDLRRVIDFLRVDEPAKERAAVVAWLRAQSQLTLYEATPDDVADAIERGDHVKEVDSE